MDKENVLFFLGRDLYIPKWRNSNKWSTFSGKSQSFEDEKNTAVREFMEETMGVWNIGTSDLNEFNLKVQTCFRKSKYTIYIKEIGTFVNEINIFMTIRKHVNYIQIILKEVNILSKKIIDHNMKTQHKLVFPSSRVVVNNSVVEVVYILKVSTFANNVYITFSYCDELEYKTTSFVYEDISPVHPVYDVIKWFNLSLIINFHVSSIYKACPLMIRWTRCGVLYSNVRIKECFIEKDLIMPWTLTELKRVLNDDIFFKRPFMPIIHAIVQEFLQETTSLHITSHANCFRYQL